MKNNIIVTGSLAYDYIFDVDDYFSKYILPDKIHQINISVITDEYKKTFGGTAGNQAFYLARLGFSPFILATAGQDFSEYKEFLIKNGINTKFIKKINNINSAAGFAMADKRDNQIWMYSVGAMKFASKLSLHKSLDGMQNYIVLITPNDMQAIINLVEECIAQKIPFTFDPAFYIPHLPKKFLTSAIKYAKVIFGNDYEIAFIEKKIEKKLEDFLNKEQTLVKTLADKGSEVFQNGKWTKVGIYKVKTVDPTGAGDAYRAGFLYGYLNDESLEICAKMGAVAASFAVEVKGTMNLKFTKKEFEKRVKML